MPPLVMLQSSMPTLPQQRDALLADCRLFLVQHGATLLDALGAVGGAPAVRIGVQLIDAAEAAPAWQTLMRQMTRLYGILTLEHLDDPFSFYPIDIATLDPTGPIAESCCWHADRLLDLVERAEAIQAGIPALPRDPRSLVRRPMRT